MRYDSLENTGLLRVSQWRWRTAH